MIDQRRQPRTFEPSLRFRLGCIGWVLAVVVTWIAVLAIDFNNHVECGGSFIGSARPRPDCMSRRRWLPLIPIAVLVVLVAWRIRAAMRRHRKPGGPAR